MSQASSKGFKRSRAHGLALSGLVFYLAHILQQAQARDAAVVLDEEISIDNVDQVDHEVTDTIMASTNDLSPVQAESSSLQSTEPTLVSSEFPETTTASFLGAVDAQDEEESSVEPNTHSFSLALTAALAGGTTLLALGNSNDDDDSPGFGNSYGFNLSTSFTGEDSLDAAYSAGQVDRVKFPLGDFSYSDFYETGDVALITPSTLNDITYTLTESVDGNSASFSIPVDVSSQALDGQSYVLRLAELSLEGGSARDLVLTFDPEGFGSSIGIFDKLSDETPGLDGYSAEIEGVAIAFASQENDAYETTLQGFQPWSGAIHLGWMHDVSNEFLSQGFQLSEPISDEVGLGTLHLATRPTGLGEGESEFDDYQVFYAYSVNDGMAITPGVFIDEAQDDDYFGPMVETSFSF